MVALGHDKQHEIALNAFLAIVVGERGFPPVALVAGYSRFQKGPRPCRSRFIRGGRFQWLRRRDACPLANGQVESDLVAGIQRNARPMPDLAAILQGAGLIIPAV